MDLSNDFAGDRVRWRFFATKTLMLDESVVMIETLATESIARYGRFNIVLTGGNTVQPLYEQVRRINTLWSAWHIYWGDERCVAFSDPNRNSKMALDHWISHVPIPPQQVHQIPTEGDLDIAIRQYQQTLKEVGTFDLVLLSLGEDGHVASLFPREHLGATPASPSVQIVSGPQYVPLLPRLSLSARRLSETRNMMIFAAGHRKKAAIRAWRDGNDLPAACLSAENGIDVFVANILEFASP